MNTFSLRLFQFGCCLFGLAGGAINAEAVPSWEPVEGVVPAMGFVMNAQSREESLYFHNSIFLASEGAENRIGWTSSYGACAPGETSPAFRADVQRRVNYYRALCGMPAAITFDAEPVVNDAAPANLVVAAGRSKRFCAQAAAYNHAFSNVFFDGFELSHNPTRDDSACFSNEAWNGAFNCNLTIGYFGPRAVDVFMADDNLTDDQSNNSNVGHRRWILYSRARDMSTGDVPPGTYTEAGTTYPVLPSNALYITSSHNPAQVAPKQFVTWPPAGYVPAAFKPLRWSISFPDAVFPALPTAIKVTGPSGAIIPVTVLSANEPKLGDSTLSFQPLQTTITGTADARFTVEVTGISGPGVPVSHRWQTTFFDPSLLATPPSLTGPAQPSAAGADYQAGAVPFASAYELLVNQEPPNATTHNENGDGAADISTDKTGTYPVLQGAGTLNNRTFTPFSGGKSLHLCFPLDETEIDSLPHNQSFALGPEFIPTASSTISFRELFRWLFTVNRLSLEISTDGGGRWAELYGRNGAYTYVVGATYKSELWDGEWAARSVSLASYASQPVRLRFILRHNDLSFDTADIHHGCYIDDISITGVRVLGSGVKKSFPTPALRLDSISAGGALLTSKSYLMRVRPRVGSKLMSYSPLLTVTAKPPTSYETANPALAAKPLEDEDGDGIGNLIEHAFGLNPMGANGQGSLPQPVAGGGNLTIGFTIPAGINDLSYAAECTSDMQTWLPVVNTGTGKRRTFTVPLIPGQKCFVRLKVSQ